MDVKIQLMVYRLQSQIRAKGAVPVRMEIWDDAVTYANELLSQLERLVEHGDSTAA